MSSGGKHVARRKSDDEEFQELEEGTPFACQVAEISEDGAKLRSMATNIRKLSLDRRSNEALTKLSNKVLGVWDGIVVKDGQLRKFKEYQESQYRQSGTFKGFEDVKLALLEWFQTEIDKANSPPPPSPSVSPKLYVRNFSVQMITKYMQQWDDGTASDELISFDFICSRVERFFERFLIYHSQVVADCHDSELGSELELESEQLTQRVQSFLLPGGRNSIVSDMIPNEPTILKSTSPSPLTL